MKYIVAEVDGGYTKVLKESYSLMDLAKMDIEPKFFPCVFITKNDIRAAVTGGSIDDMEDIDPELDAKIEALTDAEMRRIGEKMQNAYVETEYWIDLQLIFEHLHGGSND